MLRVLLPPLVCARTRVLPPFLVIMYLPCVHMCGVWNDEFLGQTLPPYPLVFPHSGGSTSRSNNRVSASHLNSLPHSSGPFSENTLALLVFVRCPLLRVYSVDPPPHKRVHLSSDFLLLDNVGDAGWWSSSPLPLPQLHTHASGSRQWVVSQVGV